MAELGEPVRRAALVQAISAHFEEVYGLFTAGRFDQVLDRWRALSVTLGQAVRVISVTGAPDVEGTAEDVDPDGALLVRATDGELRRVLAGEVSLRPR
jgi:BirA family biotin operon repressor/biotin-[acetyl-CoA-carboxylase] ligase